MERVVITSCQHLRESYRYGKYDKDKQVNLRLLDLLNYLSEVVNFAIKEKVDSVVFLGDVFDSPSPSEELKSMFYSRIKELVYSGIKIYILIGNHDTDGRVSSFDGSKTLVEDVLRSHKIKIISEPYILEEDGNTFGFIPWSNHIADDAKMLNGKVDYIFGHFCITGDKNSPNYTSLVKGGLDQVNKRFLDKVNHCFLGHIHEYYACEKYTYIGSLMKLTFASAGNPKGFLFIDFKSKKKKFIKVKDRKFIKIIVEDGDVVKSSSVKGNVIKLVLRGTKEFLSSQSRTKIVDMINKEDPFKLVVTSEVIKSDGSDGRILDVNDGFEECLKDWCKGGKKGKEYSDYGLDVLLNRCLDGEDSV